MIKARRLKRMALASLLLIPATIALPQGRGPKIIVKGQPADVLFVIAGGNKLTAPAVPAGPPSDSGNVIIPDAILTSVKPHTQMEVYVRRCVEGKVQVYIVLKGSESSLPEDTNDCKKRRLGAVRWDDGGTATIDPNAPTDQGVSYSPPTAPTTSTTQNSPLGAPTPAKSPKPLVSMQVGGGVGFNNIGGTSGDRAAFLNSFPGGTFSTSANTFAGNIGSSLGIGPIVFDFNAWRANGGDSNGSGTVPGGATDTAHITQQFQGISLTGGGKIPLGGGVSLILRGGGNFWQDNISTTEMVGTGSSNSTSKNSRNPDGSGWTTGAAVQWDFSPRWSTLVRWDYLPMRNAGVNVHLNQVSAGIMFRLFGVPK